MKEIEKVDSKFAWARDNPSGDKFVSKSVEDVRAQLNEFGTDWLLATTQQDIAKKYDRPRIIVGLGEFIQLSLGVKHLQKVCDGFVEMSRVMASIEPIST